MTIQEARQLIDECEHRITGEYSKLKDDARNMSSSAIQAQSSKTTSKTMMPLIISLLGLILCFASHPVWGVLLIIGGIFFAYTSHSSVSVIQNKIETEAKTLRTTVDSNSNI